MKPRTAEGDLVREYLKKYRSMSSRGISQMIYQAHEDVFKDSEQVRDMVRYYRRQHGTKNAKSVIDYIPKVKIPGGEVKEWTTYKITDFPVIIGSDFHIPYHDQDAVEIFIERAIEMDAKTMILNGDILDMYQCSTFMRDPAKWNPREEIEMFIEILEQIHSLLPNCKIVYKIGNHEERFDNYIMRNAPALWGMDNFNFAAAIRQYLDFDIDIIGDKRLIKALDVTIIHGHEFRSSFFSPVNPARGLFLRAKDITIGGHHHQSSHHKEPTIRGRSIPCWSTGCLCDLHPEYMPLNKWNLGFAEMHTDGDVWRVLNREIVNYRLV